MATQILTDKNGNRIGEIETDSSGRQTALDVNGNRVGEYDPIYNTTYDKNHQRIGEGNQLSSLITSSRDNNKLLWGVGGYLLGRMTSKTKYNTNMKESGEAVSPKESTKEIIRGGIVLLFLIGLSFLLITFVKHKSDNNVEGQLGYGIAIMIGYVFFVIFALALIWTILRLIFRFLFWLPVYVKENNKEPVVIICFIIFLILYILFCLFYRFTLTH